MQDVAAEVVGVATITILSFVRNISIRNLSIEVSIDVLRTYTTWLMTSFVLCHISSLHIDLVNAKDTDLNLRPPSTGSAGRGDHGPAIAWCHRATLQLGDMLTATNAIATRHHEQTLVFHQRRRRLVIEWPKGMFNQLEE
jgi:hypothetical protein